MRDQDPHGQARCMHANSDWFLPARLNGDGDWLLRYADGQPIFLRIRALALRAGTRPCRNAWLGEASCITRARPNGWFKQPIIGKLYPGSLAELYPGNQSACKGATSIHYHGGSFCLDKGPTALILTITVVTTLGLQADQTQRKWRRNDEHATESEWIYNVTM